MMVHLPHPLRVQGLSRRQSPLPSPLAPACGKFTRTCPFRSAPTSFTRNPSFSSICKHYLFSVRKRQSPRCVQHSSGEIKPSRRVPMSSRTSPPPAAVFSPTDRVSQSQSPPPPFSVQTTDARYATFGFIQTIQLPVVFGVIISDIGIFLIH